MSASNRFLLRKHRFVQAGAGTGKTHALVTQYLHLCAGLALDAQPVSPTHIVVLTFTDKAAYELQGRILARVNRLICSLQAGSAWQTEESELYATTQALQQTLPSLDWWYHVQQALYEAPIGTFHTFAQMVSRNHARVLGMDPSSRLLDETEAYTLQFQATCQTVRAGLQGRLSLIEPADTASLVAEYGFAGTPAFPALVESLMYVGNQQREGIGSLSEDPRLFLTAVWQEQQEILQQATQQLLGLAPRLSKASQELLWQEWFQQEIPAVPFSTSPEKLYATVTQWLLRHDTLSSLRAAPRSEAAAQLAEAKKQFRHSCKLLQALLTSLSAQTHVRTFTLLCESSRQAYQTAKQNQAAWDFTDLLQQALHILSQPALSVGPFRAVLVDESQDINALQAQLVRKLVWKQSPADTGLSLSIPGETKLYMVGDRKQSIYQFRGAHDALFQEMRAWFGEGQGEEETLALSYRATPALVSFGNAFFAHTFQHPLGDETEGPMRWDLTQDPIVSVRTDTPEGPVAEWVQAPSTVSPGISTEAALLALRLQQWAQEGHPWGDMVILLRRFTHVSTYAAKLREAGIPLSIVQARGLFQQPEIQDLAAALRLLLDPDDRWSWLVLLRSPFCACRDSTLFELHRLQIFSLSDWLSHTPKPSSLPADDAVRIERMAIRFHALRPSCYQVPASALLTLLCQEFQLWDIWKALPDGAQRENHAWQLIEYARQCEPEQSDVHSFVHRLNRIMDPHNPAPEPLSSEEVAVSSNAVRMMTIHQAKGLEFPMVAIPGCAQPERHSTARISYSARYGLGFSLKNHPHLADDFLHLQNERWHRAQTQAESLRLLYVAVTRAKNRVLFVGETPATAPCWRNWLEQFSRTAEGNQLQTLVLTPSF